MQFSQIEVVCETFLEKYGAYTDTYHRKARNTKMTKMKFKEKSHQNSTTTVNKIRNISFVMPA